MKYTTEQLQTKIYNRQMHSNLERDCWKTIGISIPTLAHTLTQFNNSNLDVKLAIGYGKLFIMELWSVREHLRKIDIDIVRLDEIVPRLKDWRDSYAHLEERTSGFEKPLRSKKVPLEPEKNSIAGGLLTSQGGNRWQTNGTVTMFNFKIDGNNGVTSIFGIVNDYVICNTANNILEIQINGHLLDKIFQFIYEVA